MLTDAFATCPPGPLAGGLDLDARLSSALHAVEVSTSPRAVDGRATRVESKLLEPTALAVVSQLAAALTAADQAPPARRAAGARP